VQGEGGICPPPHEALQAAREACDAVGAALIFDEIQCGLGRTGHAWAYEPSGVVPDALTTAKALGGGLPVGALVTGERLADVLQPGDHGSTFPGGPVVAAAALAALDVLLDPALHERVQDLGARLLDELAELPRVTSSRGLGLMLAIELETGDAPEVVRRALLEHRLVLNATGPTTIRLLPPLIVSDEELAEALKRLRAALDAESQV
jgi:acetylornithine/N-succinyldiaminopimelate aminotransferase